MVKRISELTPAQEAHLNEWEDRWTAIHLRTDAADREKFAQGAQGCYRAARLEWHNNIVWVSSPLVVFLASSVAAFVIAMRHRGIVNHAMDKAVDDLVSVAIGAPAISDAMCRAVHDAVNAAVNGSVNAAVTVAANGHMNDAVFDVMYRDTVTRDICRAVGDDIDRAIDLAVSFSLCHSANDAGDDPVHRAVNDAVDDAIQVATRRPVDDTRGYAAAHQAIAEAGKLENIFGTPFAFRFGASTTCPGSFFREVCGLELPRDLWERRLAYEATEEAAYSWYAHQNFVIACERPTAIHRELTNPSVTRGKDSHRLHCPDGPAVAFQDGWGVYAIHGVQIPFKQRHIVERPETITVAEIEAEENAEIRRMMIDRYGPVRYFVDSGATVVCELGADEPVAGLRTGRLLRKDVPRHEPIIYADLLNSTPEPDGTVKRYMLRVDPDAYGGKAARNLHAAVASTWRNADGSLHFSDYRDYAPVFES